MPSPKTAPEAPTPPFSLLVTGRVSRPTSFPLSSLYAMDLLDLDPVPVICGSGEPLGTTGRLRGLLLTDLINRVEVIVREHNDTKKMYVVAASDDGYKTVFSWQEIFNSANGEGILIVLEQDGQPVHTDPPGVDLISTRDYLTGPRHVRRLQTIEIIMIAS
ncbi:MAG: sulfite oxidase-like oxidoreductase [Desulfobulbus sp.]|jgi:hypothetical protein